MMVVNCNKPNAMLSDFFAMQTLPPPEAAAQAFVNWARRNPEQWELPFHFGVVQALSETWPCLTQ